TCIVLDVEVSLNRCGSMVMGRPTSWPGRNPPAESVTRALIFSLLVIRIVKVAVWPGATVTELGVTENSSSETPGASSVLLDSLRESHAGAMASVTSALKTMAGRRRNTDRSG